MKLNIKKYANNTNQFCRVIADRVTSHSYVKHTCCLKIQKNVIMYVPTTWGLHDYLKLFRKLQKNSSNNIVHNYSSSLNKNNLLRKNEKLEDVLYTHYFYFSHLTFLLFIINGGYICKN